MEPFLYPRAANTVIIRPKHLNRDQNLQFTPIYGNPQGMQTCLNSGFLSGTFKVITSHVKLHVKPDAQKVNSSYAFNLVPFCRLTSSLREDKNKNKNKKKKKLRSHLLQTRNQRHMPCRKNTSIKFFKLHFF